MDTNSQDIPPVQADKQHQHDDRLKRESADRDAKLDRARHATDKAAEKRAQIEKHVNHMRLVWNQEERARRENKVVDKNLNDSPLVKHAQDAIVGNPRNTDAKTQPVTEVMNQLEDSRFAKRIEAAIQELQLKNKARADAKVTEMETAINAMAERIRGLNDQLEALHGVTDRDRVQWATRLDKHIPYVTSGSQRRYELSSQYCGPWTVSYKSNTKGRAVDLTVYKGHFQFGKFRAIGEDDYTLHATDYTSTGSYVIVARLNAKSTELPTAIAIPASAYAADALYFNFNGVTARRVIATVTRQDVIYPLVGGGTETVKEWSDLKQCYYGEIYQDRYDGVGGIPSAPLAVAPITWESATSVTVDTIWVAGEIYGGYSAAIPAPATFTATASGTIIYLQYDRSSGSASIISGVPIPSDPQYAVLPLWAIKLADTGNDIAVEHLHYGVAVFGGDVAYIQGDPWP